MEICGICQLEIVKQQVWFKCGECDEMYMCNNCFKFGKEIGKHKKSHNYSVMPSLMNTLYDSEWTMDEEFALVDGIEKYGFGNWEAIATYVGFGKDALNCKQHYYKFHLKCDLAQDEARRCAMDAELRQKTKQLRFQAGSQLRGFMPLRGDHEKEFLDGAERILENIGGSDIKKAEQINLFDEYEAMLNERCRRKRRMVESNILDDRLHATRRGSMSQIEMHIRECLRPFERFSTVEQHDELIFGLTRELHLMRAVDTSQIDFHKLNGVHMVQEDELFCKNLLKIHENDFQALKRAMHTRISALEPLMDHSMDISIKKSTRFLSASAELRPYKIQY